MNSEGEGKTKCGALTMVPSGHFTKHNKNIVNFEIIYRKICATI